MRGDAGFYPRSGLVSIASLLELADAKIPADDSAWRVFDCESGT